MFDKFRFINEIERYKVKDAEGMFFVEIVDKVSSFEAWIGEDSMGVMEYMFGIQAGSNGIESRADFLELVEANFEEYKRMFIKKHMEAE